MTKRRTILILAVAAAMIVVALPAVAQDAEAAPAPTRTERVWPPAWIDMSLDDLKTEVEERAADHAQRVEDSPRLSDDQKTDLLEAIDGLLVAVDGADSNAEVAGLVVSRMQLERQELRADRRGETADYEAHIAGDFDRATLRLQRLTKVTGWAEAAGEDTEAITGYLAQAAAQLDVVAGGGSVEVRHDAVHIALAWLTETAVALDDL